MKTEDLVTVLSASVQPVRPGEARRRFTLALGGGMAFSFALMLVILGLNPDLASTSNQGMFWVKLAFPATLALMAGRAAFALSHPGRSAVLAWMASPFAVMLALAATVLANAPQADRTDLLLGQTWNECIFNIAALSLPLAAALVWAMRGLAPTRLRVAGLAAGLLAGAAGAMVYSLHCPELEAPFLAIWYALGMLVPAGVGAWLGPRLLHW